MQKLIPYLVLVLLVIVSNTEGKPQDKNIPARSSGDDRNRIVIPRLKNAVTLDGMSFEPAWRDIPSVKMIMQMPTFGAQPSERTEVYLAYDDVCLYVAGRLYDSEPAKIQAPTKKRDTMMPSSDFFGILLDTFNDKENALGFFTTPSGLRWDGTVFDDAVGEFPVNISWNTFWDVAVDFNNEGWFVEMRIPLTSLRFQDVEGIVIMGLITWRWIPRKNELSMFPAISPEYGAFSSWKPSQAREIEFQGLTCHRPL